MSYPEILKKWNSKDYDYFIGKDQIKKNGIVVYDDLELMYHAIIKFLEYGCEHDMRILSDINYGSIGALRDDRSVIFSYALPFDKSEDDTDTSNLHVDQLVVNAVATNYFGDSAVDIYNNYVSLIISCEHETDITGSMTKVIFGNVIYNEFKRPGDFDTCRVGERENKKIRFEVFIDKIKRYVHAHDDINAWLLLQGIML